MPPAHGHRRGHWQRQELNGDSWSLTKPRDNSTSLPALPPRVPKDTQRPPGHVDQCPVICSEGWGVLPREQGATQPLYRGCWSLAIGLASVRSISVRRARGPASSPPLYQDQFPWVKIPSKIRELILDWDMEPFSALTLSFAFSLVPSLLNEQPKDTAYKWRCVGLCY